MSGWTQKPKKTTTTLKSKEFRSFLEAGKRESRLVGAVERHILSLPFEERSQDHIHPSDIIKPEWCALAQYHALRGNYVETRDKPTLRTRRIFDTGHDTHARWQEYLRRMGVLYGLWADETGQGWNIASETYSSAEYLEVPLRSDKHMMRGHADGWVKGLGDDFLIEIKTIGSGSIRIEAPDLLAQANGDLDKAWKSIKYPFRGHLLQGQVYLHLSHLMVEEGILKSAPEEIVFIYELKANQEYKEFVVKYNPEFTADIFDKALDVAWAVKSDRPPVCSINASEGCKRCAPFRGESK